MSDEFHDRAGAWKIDAKRLVELHRVESMSDSELDEYFVTTERLPRQIIWSYQAATIDSPSLRLYCIAVAYQVLQMSLRESPDDEDLLDLLINTAYEEATK
jgi:hypothetical protein